MEKQNEFRRAKLLWEDFEKDVLYNNRYFNKHQLLSELEELLSKSIAKVEKGTIYYRARRYKEDTMFLAYVDNSYKQDFEGEELSKLEQLKRARYKGPLEEKARTNFWGFDKKNSFVPIDSNLIGDGRTNPHYVKYLYVAEQPYTAMVEIRPYLNDNISIAEIEVNEELVIIDIESIILQTDNEYQTALAFYAARQFSMHTDEYIITQVLSEYFKNIKIEGKRIDGIKYSSSLDSNGYNLSIFNYDKCEAISSKLYSLGEILYSAQGKAPDACESVEHSSITYFNKM